MARGNRPGGRLHEVEVVRWSAPGERELCRTGQRGFSAYSTPGTRPAAMTGCQLTTPHTLQAESR